MIHEVLGVLSNEIGYTWHFFIFCESNHPFGLTKMIYGTHGLKILMQPLYAVTENEYQPLVNKPYVNKVASQ